MTIKQYKDFISGEVYRHGKSDCTNNGVSARYDSLYVVAEHVTLADVEEFCKENPTYKVEQFVKVDYEFLDSHNYLRLDPINKGNKWNMFGGNYLASSDSRFKEFVNGSKYPVAIHDRYEGTDMGGN